MRKFLLTTLAAIVVLVLASAADDPATSAPAKLTQEQMAQKLAALETRVAELEARIEDYDSELALRDIRIGSLERWRRERVSGKPGSAADAAEQTDPLSRWIVWPKANTGNGGRIVRDSMAHDGVACEGFGRIAFNHDGLDLDAGEYTATFRIRATQVPRRMAQPTVTLKVVQLQGTKWQIVGNRNLSPQFMTASRYAAYKVPFTLTKGAKVRMVVKQLDGAVTRLERIDIAKVGYATQ